MQSLKTSLSLGTIALLVGACSGNGTLALRLTDAPPDLENIAAVTVTLSSAEAHFAGDDDHAEDRDGGATKKEDDGDAKKDDDGEGDGHWVRVSGAPLTYDLLRLQNGVSELIGEIALPDGKITQLRLFIDEAGPNNVTLKNGQVCALDLGGVDKKGIKINHPFKALELKGGKRVEVVIDLDVKESVEQAGACAYSLKPVIKIKSVH
jgi:hypothetical protein